MTDSQKSEIRKAAFAVALDVIRERKADGKEASPSKGVVHAIILVKVLDEITASHVKQADESDEESNQRLYVSQCIAALEVENGSALRQVNEVKEILGEANAKLGKDAAIAKEFGG